MKGSWPLGIVLLVSLGFVGTVEAKEGWLVRSTGSTVHTLWLDGSVTKGDPKTDYNQSENRCHSEKQKEKRVECQDDNVVDLSGWLIIAYGTSGYASPSFLTFRNPDDQTDIIQVFYDRSTDEIVDIKRYSFSPIDGTRTEQDMSNLEFDAPVYSEVVANW